MKIYLDTSVVLAYLLEKNNLLFKIPKHAHVGSSRLMWIEVSRVLERTLQNRTLSSQQIA